MVDEGHLLLAFLVFLLLGILVLAVPATHPQEQSCPHPTFYMEPNHALLASPERTSSPGRETGSRILEESIVGGPWENQ